MMNWPCRFSFGSLALLSALLVASCGVPPPQPEPDARRIRLSWSGDADFDLEVWRDEGDDSPVLIGKASEISGGGRDEVAGAGGGSEFYDFKPGAETTPFLAVAAFWAPGPSGRTSADVVMTADGFSGELRGKLDDDTRDIWFAFRIDPATGAVQPVNEYAFRGL